MILILLFSPTYSKAVLDDVQKAGWDGSVTRDLESLGEVGQYQAASFTKIVLSVWHFGYFDIGPPPLSSL